MCRNIAFAVLFVAAFVFGSLAVYAASEDPVRVDIQVAPQVLVLGAVQAGQVTIHVEYPRAGVIADSVALTIGNHVIPAISVFADSTGELVARFSERAVKAVVGPPSATLTLTGKRTVLVEGNPVSETFIGTQTVPVRVWSK